MNPFPFVSIATETISRGAMFTPAEGYCLWYKRHDGSFSREGRNQHILREAASLGTNQVKAERAVGLNRNPFCNQAGLEKERDGIGYWNRKWALRDEGSQENMTLDGSDGEESFDREVVRRARHKQVLDVGCGPGEFTLQVAERAKSVVGIDTSGKALELAKKKLEDSGVGNVGYRFADIHRLPLHDDQFDVVFSRRGPASVDRRSLAEVFRVLKKGGTFMEITIGERDKQNIVKIFGRGQMKGFRGQVSTVKKGWLSETGFRNIIAKDYLATEVFHTMDDLVIRLRTAPIIPSFDVGRDGTFLKRVAELCTTDRGVETPVHRVVLIARK